MQKLSCLVWPFSFSFGKSQRTIISRVYVIWWGRRNSLKYKLQHTDFNSREYGAQPWTSIEMDGTLDFDCYSLGGPILAWKPEYRNGRNSRFWLLQLRGSNFGPENLNNLTPTQPIFAKYCPLSRNFIKWNWRKCSVQILRGPWLNSVQILTRWYVIEHANISMTLRVTKDVIETR